MKKFNVTNSQYTSPKFKEFHNLTYLYSMPYGKITLDPTEKNFELKIIVYLKNKTAMYYKFKPEPDTNLREKYFKCFTFDITQVPGKINKVQIKMKVTGWQKKSMEVATCFTSQGFLEEPGDMLL